MQVVVSLCKETRLHFVHTILETVLSGHDVQLVPYAKCGPHAAFPEATPLENVGREGHTYWTHMQRLLAAPETDMPDVVLFLNGGSGSKGAETVSEVFRLTHSLSTANLSHWWFGDKDQRVLLSETEDGAGAVCRNAIPFHFRTFRLPEEPDATPEVTAREFVARARAQCSNASECCPLCDPTRCCLQFGPDNICPRSSQRMFDDQVGCEYLGRTRENYVDVAGPMPLAVPEPANFVQWLARWGIHYATFESVQWAHEGNFAVSGAAIREMGRERVAAAAAELAGAGLSGGMVGMYYERAWRVLFLVLTCKGWDFNLQ